jgi:hypothetical protein
MRRLVPGPILVLAGCAGIAGCAGMQGPSAESMQAARTFPANYKAELLAHLRTFLNDPSQVRNAYLSEPALTRIGGTERYINCVRFDARTSAGTYRGSRDHLASYFDGKLEQFVELRPEASERCRSADYQPFPELERLSRR